MRSITMDLDLLEIDDSKTTKEKHDDLDFYAYHARILGIGAPKKTPATLASARSDHSAGTDATLPSARSANAAEPKATLASARAKEPSTGVFQAEDKEFPTAQKAQSRSKRVRNKIKRARSSDDIVVESEAVE